MSIKETLVEYKDFLKDNLNTTCYDYLFNEEASIDDGAIWREWCEDLYRAIGDGDYSVDVNKVAISYELKGEYTKSKNPTSFMTTIEFDEDGFSEEDGLDYDYFMRQVDNFRC